jgi:hypothetical protein
MEIKDFGVQKAQKTLTKAQVIIKMVDKGEKKLNLVFAYKIIANLTVGGTWNRGRVPSRLVARIHRCSPRDDQMANSTPGYFQPQLTIRLSAT